MKLIIAEKPSLAKAIREVVGKEYTVTNAFGHILEQAGPDEYTPAEVPVNPKTSKKRWRLEDLPIFPQTWIKHPKPDAKEQLMKIKGMLKEAALVVNAGDPDREGQLLIDEILEYCGYRGPVQRVWLASLDETSVKKAFANLRDNKEYRTLSQAAEARSQADWVVGMNLTRAWTIKNNGLLSVGRVQTPTLALVVRRDLEIEQFKPRDFFEVIAHCRHQNGEFVVKWRPAVNDGPGFDEEGRLVGRQLADSIAAKAAGHGKIARYDAKDSKQSAPLPFSLSALQKAASAKFGMSANQVLETAQSLYEMKITSYPRSDARYLPEEQYSDAGRILSHLPIPDPLKAKVLANRKHAAWNTGKVTAHHAIIPTGDRAAGLTDAEQKIYDLIWKSYVALFLPDYLYKAISVAVDLGGEQWTTSGRLDMDMGWKALYGASAADDDEDGDGEGKAKLPSMTTGDAIAGQKGEVQAKQTKPPARFTDGTMIEAMSNIHKFVTDATAKAKLKETSGIGTEATRANHLSSIADGKLDPNKFMGAIQQMVREQLGKVTAGVSVSGGKSGGGSGGTKKVGPQCPDCKAATIILKTKTGKPFVKCEKCGSAWWPDRNDPKKLGSKWEARK
ncbi:DNA topoisomerase III [Acidithiobacillus ferrivorans SS3]|uniref:DNA topoisomerase n=1 Tax=Acidithiobacillus ferrivorans SS3 TaxID=743299 RepID=G0JLI6_9PROT|nr:DNA topoisomerase [Acidithiobacillus ferrivorans]AEM48035.1 DNA topoisomerase III [Acidithiobacillus ferrivorans SS3]